MKIAQVAPLWIPIPPVTYGGTELIVHLLTEELIKRGHEVTLFASGDSETSAKLVSVWPKSLWRAKLSSPHAIVAEEILKVVELQDNFDIIHNHTDFYLTPSMKYINKPIVSTIHRPFTEETIKLFKKFSNTHYVALTEDHKLSGAPLRFTRTIYNGIDLEKYPYEENPEDYFLWLSKITPEKGVQDAIEVARQAKIKLIIAGNIIQEHEKFFRYEILPLIDNKKIIYVGEADFAKKIELLKNAKALLYPIKRREPYGLVIVEAMACGTPVIAYRKGGAMPELVKHGESGCIVDSPMEMALAIKKIGNIQRINCRRWVERLFSHTKMVDEYENLYKEILGEAIIK